MGWGLETTSTILLAMHYLCIIGSSIRPALKKAVAMSGLKGTAGRFLNAAQKRPIQKKERHKNLRNK
jgi:hypothetical protein